MIVPTSPFRGYGGQDALFGDVFVHLALVFVFAATALSVISIMAHFKNYRKPHLQRYVVRIIMMVPIYAVSSWVSLRTPSAAFYIDPCRDIYEAFAMYCFFNLLINYAGGERSLLVMFHGRPPIQNPWYLRWIKKEINIGDPYGFLFLKRGILLYVIMKPLLALATLVLKLVTDYRDGYIAAGSASTYIYVVGFITSSWTVYCLYMFYHATANDLSEFRPGSKFICVKMVLVFSFWQAVIIYLLTKAKIIHSGEEYTSDNNSEAIQDFSICIEMFPAALLHWYAFSHKDYDDPSVQSARMPIYYAVRDAFGFKDVVEDVHQSIRGTSYNYRTFEPAEGMAHAGSRSARIMAGLRYAAGGASKYWVDDPNQRTPLLAPDVEQDQNCLEFPDELDAEVEQLYDHIRRVSEFGDYNFPVINASHDVIGKQPKRKRKGTLTNRGRPEMQDVPETDDEETEEARDERVDELAPSLPKDRPERKQRQLSDLPPYRDGCVDLVVADKTGRHLQSYADKITPPPAPKPRSSSAATPFVALTLQDPFVSQQAGVGMQNSSFASGSFPQSQKQPRREQSIHRPYERRPDGDQQEEDSALHHSRDPLGVDLERNIWGESVW